MFNTIINYRFILIGIPPVKDETLFLKYLYNWSRPFVGGLVTIKDRRYKIVKSVPSSNPDNVSVTYYLQEYNPHYPYKRGPQKMKLKYRSTAETDQLLV